MLKTIIKSSIACLIIMNVGAYCTNVDYSERFGPIRDQNGHGLCWAFAGASLIEESLCLEDPAKCKNEISVIDGHRCFWDKYQGMGKEYEGAFDISTYLKCFQKKGACAEKDAPYVKDQVKYTSAIKKLHFILKDIDRELSQINGRYCMNEHYSDEDRSRVHELSLNMLKVTQQLDREMSLLYGNQNLNSADEVFQSSGVDETLSNIFIPKQCREKRIAFKKKYDITKKTYNLRRPDNKQQTNNKLNDLAMALDKGRSVGLGFCSNRAMMGEYEDLFILDRIFIVSREQFEIDKRNGPCGGHAVVVVGMREKNGKCEIKIRNSWGEGSAFSGWVDSQNILEHTDMLEYFHEK